MNNNDITNFELLYQANIQFTGTVAYGTRLQDISSGKVAIPLTGARFDQTFVGELHGPKLQGEITGTDYLYVRPDGLFQLHLHARVYTQDRVHIAFSSTGVSLQSNNGDIAHIRSAVSLFTSSEAYLWVNNLHLCALGTLDISTGIAKIKAYAL
jgi:Protein of unknown function (DUF3237)